MFRLRPLCDEKPRSQKRDLGHPLKSGGRSFIFDRGDGEHPGYCTVTCKLAVLLMEPEVAVIVTALVPDGVPGLEVVSPLLPLLPLPLFPPPPQPMRTPPRVSARMSPNDRLQRTKRRLPGITNRRTLPSAKSPVIPERSTDACAAVVAMVKVVVTALAPGVTVAGANVQVASEGRPLQVKVTGCAKPPAGVTESVVVPLWPAVMERLAGLAPRVKEGGTGACTVTVTAVEVEAAKLLSPPYCAVMLCAPVDKALLE